MYAYAEISGHIRGQLPWRGGKGILIVAAPRPSTARVDELGTCICVAVVVVECTVTVGLVPAWG